VLPAPLTDSGTSDEADNGSDGNRSTGLAEGNLYIGGNDEHGFNVYTDCIAPCTYSSDEDNSLDTFSKDGDERQQEQRPLSIPSLLLGVSSLLSVLLQQSGRGDLVVESLSQLDTPLDTGSVHLEKGKTHDVDQDGSDDAEDTFPQLL